MCCGPISGGAPKVTAMSLSEARNPNQPRRRQFGRGILMAAAMAALLAGGCRGMGDITGSIGGRADTAVPTSPEALRAYSDDWGRRNEASPGNKTAALNYARALRAQERYEQAVAMLQTAALKNPADTELRGAYGKALADAGRLKEAAEVLANSHTPEHPNWSILSTQGSVADELGDHTLAQSYYAAALKIVPGEPSVLSNLGLSYALSKDLTQAEGTLRQAAAHPRADMRVRQNLALVLALQGKFSEAEEVARRDLPPGEASANVASIRAMIAQSNTWRDIQKSEPAKPTRKPASRS